MLYIMRNAVRDPNGHWTSSLDSHRNMAMVVVSIESMNSTSQHRFYTPHMHRQPNVKNKSTKHTQKEHNMQAQKETKHAKQRQANVKHKHNIVQMT